MEETLEKDTVLTLRMSGRQIVNTHPWDSNMYELLDSFIGACISLGFPIETVNEVLEDYTDNVKEQKKDAKSN